MVVCSNTIWKQGVLATCRERDGILNDQILFVSFSSGSEHITIIATSAVLNLSTEPWSWTTAVAQRAVHCLVNLDSAQRTPDWRIGCHCNVTYVSANAATECWSTFNWITCPNHTALPWALNNLHLKWEADEMNTSWDMRSTFYGDFSHKHHNTITKATQQIQKKTRLAWPCVCENLVKQVAA